MTEKNASNSDEIKHAEQQILKEICRKIKNNRKIEYFPDLFNDLMGLGVSASYENIIGRGRAGAATIEKMKQWIITHELELAFQTAPLIFPRSLRTDWQAFIAQRGRYNGLIIKPFNVTNLHELSDLHPISDTRIKLGQEFTFELDSPIYGAVIALDYYEGEWYPIPLRHNGVFDPIAITNGLWGFPMNVKSKTVIPMRQRAHKGEHGHCFIIGPSELMTYYAKSFRAGQALSLKILDTMAKRLVQVEDHKLAIFLENVIFE